MACLQWALTCRDFSVDSETNNITYRDAIEQVKATEFPADLPPFITISMLWRRDDIEVSESFRYRVILEDKNRDEASRTEPNEVDLADHERFRANIVNPPISIEEPGTIWFRIQKNENGEWENCAELPVEIKEMEEPVREAIEAPREQEEA